MYFRQIIFNILWLQIRTLASDTLAPTPLLHLTPNSVLFPFLLGTDSSLKSNFNGKTTYGRPISHLSSKTLLCDEFCKLFAVCLYHSTVTEATLPAVYKSSLNQLHALSIQASCFTEMFHEIFQVLFHVEYGL